MTSACCTSSASGPSPLIQLFVRARAGRYYTKRVHVQLEARAKGEGEKLCARRNATKLTDSDASSAVSSWSSQVKPSVLLNSDESRTAHTGGGSPHCAE